MNNNIFNRNFFILIFLPFIVGNNLIAKEKSAGEKSELRGKKPSLMLLKSYYNYYSENNYNTNSPNISSSEEQTYTRFYITSFWSAQKGGQVPMQFIHAQAGWQSPIFWQIEVMQNLHIIKCYMNLHSAFLNSQKITWLE